LGAPRRESSMPLPSSRKSPGSLGKSRARSGDRSSSSTRQFQSAGRRGAANSRQPSPSRSRAPTRRGCRAADRTELGTPGLQNLGDLLAADSHDYHERPAVLGEAHRGVLRLGEKGCQRAMSGAEVEQLHGRDVTRSIHRPARSKCSNACDNTSPRRNTGGMGDPRARAIRRTAKVDVCVHAKFSVGDPRAAAVARCRGRTGPRAGAHEAGNILLPFVDWDGGR